MPDTAESSAPAVTNVAVTTHVSRGLATSFGLSAAVAQFLAAIAAFIVAWQSKDSTLILGSVAPALTGGATLAAVLQGRYKQAVEAIKAASTPLQTAQVVLGQVSEVAGELEMALDQPPHPDGDDSIHTATDGDASAEPVDPVSDDDEIPFDGPDLVKDDER